MKRPIWLVTTLEVNDQRGGAFVAGHHVEIASAYEPDLFAANDVKHVLDGSSRRLLPPDRSPRSKPHRCDRRTTATVAASPLATVPLMPDRYADVRDLDGLFDRYWQGLMEDSPETATYVGWHEHHDRWTDLSPEAIERRRMDPGAALDALATVDRTRDPLSAEIFESVVARQARAAAFPGELLPLDQLDGPQNDIPLLLSAMGLGTDDQHADYLSRLRGIPQVLEGTIDLMDRGIAQGLTAPAVCLRDVPAQIDAHLTDDPWACPELVPLACSPSPVRDEASAIVVDDVLPAFARLRAYLVDRYIPAARETIAFTALPDGHEWYAERVGYHTTTDLTPAEIHEIGVAEVERITAAMRDVAAESGFAGDAAAFAEHLRTDDRFYFDTPEALLAFYRDIAKRIDPAVPRLFGLLPRLPFGIAPVPPEQAPSAPAAFYLQGSLALGRPGTFYANTFDLRSRPSWNMESICLHEAVPGHHFQISIAQEMEGLPEFRRQSLSCTAYVEGWGLYCESLGPEMGMYADPYQRYGALDAELLRAIRLVTDTGMHALGWTREKAIAYFEEHSPMPHHDVVVEVDRYLVLPGQALAYKVGELKIQELRHRHVTATAGLRDFHDEVLRHGALPLDVLERLVDERFAT